MSTIKFEHGEDGKVVLNCGKSTFVDLFLLGAIELTAKINYSEKNCCYDYAKDKEGLEQLVLRSSEVLNHLHDSIQAISVVLTNPDNEEIKDNLSDLAWILVGLTELSATVAHTNHEMSRTLRMKKPN
jgi:predicted P-loop ATPase/GTPase